MKRRRPNRKAHVAAAAAAGPARLVQIEKPVYGGSFLAREEGKAIFVPLVLPGERARVQIVEDRVKRGYAKAELVELLAQAPERIASRCPHFGPCGGCHYQHATYEAQVEFKRQILRETLERGGVEAPDAIAVLAAEPWRYRNRIRVAFDADGNPGYRGRRSHAAVPVRECPIAAPVLVEAALSVAQLFKKLPVPSRPAELSLFCDAAGESILASVLANAPARTPLPEYLDALRAECRNIQGVELIELRGEQARAIAQSGAASLNYEARNFRYRVDHGAFFQINRWLIDPLIESVVDRYRGRTAWDLFAGVGLFARQLTSRFERVMAVEASPLAANSLQSNLAGSTGEAHLAPSQEFLRRSAAGPRPDLIVVDPPRTGLGEESVPLLNRIAAPAIAYVSCDPATLARDLRALLAGGYAVESLTLVDLFPQTFHLETVVHLRRA